MEFNDLNAKEKKKIIYNAIEKWRKETKEYILRIKIYLWLMFLPILLVCIVSSFFSLLIALVFLIITTIYFLIVILPLQRKWKMINRCNIKNIKNVEFGIVQRKYYKNRIVSVFIMSKSNIQKTDKIKTTENQFNRLRTNDNVMYFEYYPGEFAITDIPKNIEYTDLDLFENNNYKPTRIDIENFTFYRTALALYDNYIMFGIFAFIIISRNNNWSF